MLLKPTSILLSNSISHILSKFAKSRTLPICQVERAKIVLLCANGFNHLQISEKVSIRQILSVNGEFIFFKAFLTYKEVEEKNPMQLEKEVKILPVDKARPGRSPTYTEEQIIKILELACRKLEEYGYETNHWSLNELVGVVKKEGIEEKISAKTICRFLKYGEDSPISRPLLAALLGKSRISETICRKSE